MVLPIRPTSNPVTPATGPSDRARAAQRAFFQTALGNAQASAPVAQPTAPVASVAPAVQINTQPSAQPSAPLNARTIPAGAPLPKVDTETPPDPYARPGSRLNIRI